MSIEFTVQGQPVPQGSLTFYGRGKKPSHRTDLKPWRAKVRAEYVRQAASESFTGPVAMHAEFVLPRPKAHYGTGGNTGIIKRSYERSQPTSPPDVDKCLRAIADALTLDKGELQGLPRPFENDSQITIISGSKRYVQQGEEPHAVVTIQLAYT